MERTLETTKEPLQRRRFWRKSLVLPAEHGSWSWLLVPFFAGVLVAGRFGLAGLLALVSGLSGFLLRQPATAWLQIRRGRGRQADHVLAAGWTVGLLATAVLSLLGLLALGRSELLWLAVPLLVLLLLYLAVARQRRANTRTLEMEVAGAAGLAIMAPFAYGAAAGHLDAIAWALWGLMALQNVLGVLYVRLRLADTHGRPMGRRPVLWAHALALLAVGLAALGAAIPWPAVLPVVFLLARAWWAVLQPRPIANIKRFGFREVGVEALAGLWIAASYWLLA
ncbi:MAG: YwiC-like family protein [Chloroflexi bacterium]|nr:YwiC-like family protein [Chloroflexota bacterium]MCI0577829.1 YwiC-like family protein [Chloroflexota bacterium]MCI0646126.1 YwiC-like family protein [Chloroflexota bacterium]MCI0731328.1 YwiC-like family protein [Chloroflexota bacterium]